MKSPMIPELRERITRVPGESETGETCGTTEGRFAAGRQRAVLSVLL